MITLALHPVDDPTSYGLVRRDDDGTVLGFLEKPDPAEIDTDEVSAGAYVIERQVLDLIPAGRAVSIEREVFPRLVGQGLYGRRLEGYWMDIGTPERYLQASWDILEGAVETELPGTAGRSSARVPRSPTAPRSSRAPSFAPARGSKRAPLISESVLLDGCRIGAEAEVRGVDSRRRCRCRRRGNDRCRQRARRACAGRGRGDGRARIPRSARRARRGRGAGMTARGDPRGRPERPARRRARRCPTIFATRSGGSSPPGLEPEDSSGLIVCGMGGSAIGGVLARAAIGDRLNLPMLVYRDYELPLVDRP